MVAIILAGFLLLITLGLVDAAFYGAGEAAGGMFCLAVPTTVAVFIAGLLGTTEEAPNGNRRDGTLAKYSLLVAAGCWFIGALVPIACRLLRP